MAKRKRATTKKADTVPFPSNHQDEFKAATFRTNFQLHLSQAMIEYICAVDEDVQWDRAQFGGLYKPDNFIATSAALMKRGLIARKTQADLDKSDNGEGCFEWNRFKLTEIGEALVNLFRVAGIFVQSDNGLAKKLRRG